MLKFKCKQKIIKAGRGKQLVMYDRVPIRLFRLFQQKLCRPERLAQYVKC